MTPAPSRSVRPAIRVAVVMRRERIAGAMARWQPFRWVLADVVPHEDGFGTAPRLLLRNDDEERWLHPDFKVELFRDDAEGYYLNVSTDAPCWWVLWRLEETASVADVPLALPQAVSLSYHDAGRWLDAQETVEQVPAPPHIVEWVQVFVNDHYTPEPRRRQPRPVVQPLLDRFGNPASVSTGKRYGRETKAGNGPGDGHGDSGA
jgi:Protein of unknown function (DUF3305)